jgi:hypothetical protein
LLLLLLLLLLPLSLPRLGSLLGGPGSLSATSAAASPLAPPASAPPARAPPAPITRPSVPTGMLLRVENIDGMGTSHTGRQIHRQLTALGLSSAVRKNRSPYTSGRSPYTSGLRPWSETSGLGFYERRHSASLVPF